MTETDFPVTLTPKARDQVRKLLARNGREHAFLRVGVKGGGCSGLEYLLKLDTEKKPHDLCAVLDGVPVVCDAKSAVYLQGAVLDHTGNLIGGGFKFENPNASRSCGCGTSFTPKTERDSNR
jgi:iron-sulfur cluster assembly protein